ncbi:hypothetical protein [Halobacteriovorax sp.]|uniref:hypothetical protein n=1 Tax=Halobacteriovorax sp. TaxID=2020862 RepID=UPI003563F804
MSDGKMQQLIDKVRKQYPTLTNKRGDSESYAYLVRNKEILINVGRSSNSKSVALTGEVTDLKHSRSGIAMMAAAYNRGRNNIYYVHTTKTKSAEIEKELKQIEKFIKTAAIEVYGISDKKADPIYCNGMTKDKDVSNLLQRFLYENISQESTRELNAPVFSFMDLLDILEEDSWSNLISNQKSAQLACKLFGIN